MAHIYKRKDTWWIKYHVNGKAVYRSLKTENKTLALREKAALEAKLLNPHRTVETPKNPLCDVFWQEYLKRVSKRENTIAIETHHWNLLVAHTGARRLADITSEGVESFKLARKQGGAADQSVNNALKDIQTIFNYAIKLKLYTGQNPAKDIPRYRLTRTLPKFHTDAELEELLKAAAKRGKQLEWVVLLGAMAGLRKNEILSSHWDWFDFERKVVCIRRYPGFEIKDHEERVVPMHPRIHAAMSGHTAPGKPVFASGRPTTGKNRYPYEPDNALTSSLREAGLSTKDPYQRLRDTFASLRAQKGVSIFKLSKWLGHSSVKTTERHYAALATGYDADIE